MNNAGWDKMRKLYQNLHPIRYKWEQFLEKYILGLVGLLVLLALLIM